MLQITPRGSANTDEAHTVSHEIRNVSLSPPLPGTRERGIASSAPYYLQYIVTAPPPAAPGRLV
jgi:hypothetical protein